MKHQKAALLLTIMASATCLPGCDYIPTPESKVKSEVKKNLIDPDSAKFDRIFIGNKTDGNTGNYCGFVNSKNRMGGYVGNTPFIATAHGEYYDIKFIKEPPTDSDFRMYHHLRSKENYIELSEKCEGVIEFEKTCGIKVATEVPKLCNLMNDATKLNDELFKLFD